MENEEKKPQQPTSAATENPLEAMVNNAHEEAMKPKDDGKKTEEGGSRFQRFKHWYGSHKKFSIPLTIVAVILLLATIPWSRYQAVGMVYKKDFSLRLTDSTANSPVSGATVKIGSVSAITDADGKVTLPGVKPGKHKAAISKKYYQDAAVDILVPILNQKNTPTFKITATGRQAKVEVSNTITNERLEGVTIKVAGAEAKTDKKGEATVVVPVGEEKQKATLSRQGYNTTEVTLEVSGKEIKLNAFELTPSGRIYFMSKRTGKLDVMKVNLDGSDAKVAVAGTGTEQDDNTRLLASPDGKYAALVARRSTAQTTAQLYMISAEDDKLTSVDTGSAEFSLIGWSGSRLVYVVTRNDLPTSAAGKSKLKSYDAASGRITSLDQTEAGDAAIDAGLRYDFVRLSGDTVVFAKTWYGNTTALAGKVDSFSIIGTGGGGHKVVATYDTAANFMSYSQHSPVGFYIRQGIQASGEEKFFDYTVGGTPKEASINISQFYGDNYDYFFSPSGKQVLWAEERDGKMAFIVADANDSNPKVVTSLDEFTPLGWYSDQYLLVSFRSRELHIMGVGDPDLHSVTNYQSTYTFY